MQLLFSQLLAVIDALFREAAPFQMSPKAKMANAVYYGLVMCEMECFVIQLLLVQILK